MRGFKLFRHITIQKPADLFAFIFNWEQVLKQDLKKSFISYEYNDSLLLK